MTRCIFGLRICFALALSFASPAFADSSCFKQTFVEKWAEKYSSSGSTAKEAIHATDMPEILDEIYDHFIDRALQFEDARTAFEAFEVNWNIRSYDAGIPDYELVPLSLRPCVEWMWSK